MAKSIEERMAKIEGIMEQISKSLNHVQTRINILDDKIDKNFRWIIGIQITMWVTIILTVLFKV